MDTPIPTLNTRIAQFIELRDRKREIETRHKDELTPCNRELEQLEAIILGMLDASGIDNARVTGLGTAYKTTRKSASLADADQFRRFVIGSEAWDLLDWRANAVAVADFIEANNLPPPGVNYSTTVKIGVRR